MNSESQVSSIRDWLITGILPVSLLAGAWVWRNQTSGTAPSDPAPPTSTHAPAPQEAIPLARTLQLVKQKLGSLKAYNNPIAQADYLKEFSYWAENRAVEPGAFDTLSRLMMDRIVPELWNAAQQEAGPNQRVTHSAMAHVIHQRWPQQLLPNEHVVLFPNHPRLRLVALERRQDYLRDTGRLALALNWACD